MDSAAHSHDHDGHRHHHHGAGNERRLGLVALLTGGFMLAEVAGGLISGSLALLADAGHMLTDFASLALAWAAARVARRPADWKRTYGFDRFSVLAAFVNGIALFAISAWIAIEAVRRFLHPIAVDAAPMLGVAVLGLVVNLVAFRILHGDHAHDLNTRSAALHVLGDLLGSVAAIGAALVILWTGWTPIDPLLSVLVVLLILGAGLRVVRDSGRILLEAAPKGLDTRKIAAELDSLPGVAGVRHLHVWSISEQRPMITLEARLTPGSSGTAIREAIRARLRERYGIAHATIETEEDDGLPEPSRRSKGA